MRGELDHAEHQRDAGRIVDARLALEDRPRAPADLAAAEHREHHRGIGGRHGRADNSREDPVEAQRVVSDERHDPGGCEGAEQPDREDRGGGRAEPAPADVHAAVEEDHDQRDDRDPLHRLDRHRVVDLRPDDGDRRSRDQEDRRRRHRNPLGQRRRERRDREAGGHEKNDGAEVGDLGHGEATPTRLPGTPPARLSAPKPHGSILPA